MNSDWGPARGAERYAVPVEMRFIDMFMAALGALIFMAMLLAFLVGRIPPVSPPPPSVNVESLHLLTGFLPPARAAQPYEVAFAYRGARGPVTWEVAAGSQEIPSGMRLDTQLGILAGTPSNAGTAHFVLRVRDSAKSKDERAYELKIEPERKSSRGYERWLAGIVIGIAWLVQIFSIGIYFNEKKEVAYLEQMYKNGHTSVRAKTADGVYEIVELPRGIYAKRASMKGTAQFARFWFIGMTIMSVFLLWRFWLS